MRGDFATARDLCSNARAILDELGWKMLAALTSIDSGVASCLGDPVAAERELRDTDARADGRAQPHLTTTAFLADALSVRVGTAGHRLHGTSRPSPPR
jgi:hypothetical protein